MPEKTSGAAHQITSKTQSADRDKADARIGPAQTGNEGTKLGKEGWTPFSGGGLNEDQTRIQIKSADFVENFKKI